MTNPIIFESGFLVGIVILIMTVIFFCVVVATQTEEKTFRPRPSTLGDSAHSGAKHLRSWDPLVSHTIQNYLRNRKIKRFTNNGGGDCFYRALSQAFYQTQEHHLNIRNSVLDEIEVNWDSNYGNYVTQRKGLFLAERRKPGSWPGEIEMAAAGHLYSKQMSDFVVLSVNKQYIVAEEWRNLGTVDVTLSNLYLFYNGTHYEWIQVDTEKNGGG
jgi:uncharacterized protein (UPF0333 family)